MMSLRRGIKLKITVQGISVSLLKSFKSIYSTILALALLLHTAAHAPVSQNDPPNHANSNVPYVVPSEPRYDYAEALHKSFLFYHSQRSGKLGPNRRLAWRGDSCVDCSGPNGEDLSGGYFEAANTMKWGLPLAWTLSQLSFNVHVFSKAMQGVKEYNEALDAVKWGTDYLINCISRDDQFVGQLGVSAIGDTDIDFGYFGPVEEYELWVPEGIKHSDGVAYINSTNPSSEILGESAAALAAASAIFTSNDQKYADKLLKHALDLYNRAVMDMGSYMESTHPNLQAVKEWYPSTSYVDELAWAAAWLYVASGKEKYKIAANKWIQQREEGSSEYSWDEKLPGANLLLFMQTKEAKYEIAVKQYFSVFWPEGSVKQTAKGLSYPYSWGSISCYACNTGFVMMAYAKTVGYNHTDAKAPIEYAAQQINYALGDSGRSWVVGFGKNSPKRPYHKSSYNSFIDYPMRGKDNSDQGDDFLYSDTVNRFTLYGAVEGGPAWDDTFEDSRKSYEFTDKYSIYPVTLDYNAAFTGLNAAMIDYYGHGKFKAFSDCGLDLGWSHPNASDPPRWSADDCYHKCC